MKLAGLILALLGSSAVIGTPLPAQTGTSGYRVIDAIPLQEVSGWDALSIDARTRTLFITDNGGVLSLNIDTLRPIGRIGGGRSPIVGGIHAVAISDELGLGFISIEEPSSIVAFDLQSHQIRYTTKVDKGADEIVYDSSTQRVFTLNGKASGVHDLSAVDAKSGKFLGNIALPSRPESGVSDRRGHMYVSLPEANQVVQVDTKSLNVSNLWKMKECDDPSALAIDSGDGILFASCKGATIHAFNTRTREIIGQIHSGRQTDEMAFDVGTGQLFAANGVGTLTIGKLVSTDRFYLQDIVASGPGARTMALDPKTHRVFVMSAQVTGRRPPTANNPHGYGQTIPGTVKLLVLGR